jgi:hypothetical protein
MRRRDLATRHFEEMRALKQKLAEALKPDVDGVAS